MHKFVIQQTLQRLDELPSLPAVAVTLIHATLDGTHDLDELVGLIETDQGLSLKVLALAHSAAFARRRSPGTVREAVVRLGLNRLKSLVLSVGVLEALQLQQQGTFPFDAHWRHALACAFVAKRLAQRVRPTLAEEAFMAGMLHDVGKLVLHLCFPDLYTQVQIQATAQGQPLWVAEQAVFGCDHAQVGRWALERWHLPVALQDAIWLHHQEISLLVSPDSQPSHLPLLVALANRLCHTQGWAPAPEAPTLPTHWWDLVALSASEGTAILAGIAEEVESVASAMGLGPLETMAGAVVLQKANHALGQLHLTAEAQGQQLKEQVDQLTALQAMGTALQTVTSLHEGLVVLATHVLQSMQGQDVWCTLTLETGQALGVHTTENRLGEVQITTQVWDTPNAALVAQTQAPQAIRLALVAEPTVRGTLTVARHPEAPALTGSMLTMLDLFAQMGALALAQRRLVDRWQEQADHFVRLSTTLQQAHAETQFLSHLLMSTQDGILGTDLNQQIRFCNPQATALLGQEQTTLLGAQLATVFPAAVQQEVAQRSDMVCHGGMQAAFVFTHHLPARPARYMSLRLAPITNAQQAQVGMAAVLSDITARLQLEVEQQQAYKMQAVSTLAGGIAHDFNNILAAIMGFTELALADLPDVSRVSQHLEEVINASRRATQIVQQLLTFSHTERADRQAIQLSRVVQEVVTLLRGSLPTTITVQEQYLAERDTILATPVQMRQMLMNLWLNAVYAMRDTGGTLAIQVDTVVLTDTAAEPHLDLQPGAYVRLRVCDTGMGMTPEVVNRIFEPFFTTRRTGEGSGMGLAMVHGIIRQHGGTITVQSAPQAGTTFVILLPGHEDARLAIP